MADRSVPSHRQHRINRAFMREEEQQPQAQTLRAGIDFLRRNADQDNWFLQIETCDPHEPFFVHRKYQDHFAARYERYRGPVHDWPNYDWVTETPQEVEHMRTQYASLLAMCDAKLGDLLDTMGSSSPFAAWARAWVRAPRHGGPCRE